MSKIWTIPSQLQSPAQKLLIFDLFDDFTTERLI